MSRQRQQGEETFGLSKIVGSALDDTQLWAALIAEAEAFAKSEPMLRPYLNDVVLRHGDFASALGAQLSNTIFNESFDRHFLAMLHFQAVSDDPSIVAASSRDLRAFNERDPAAETVLFPFLYQKGFQAVQWHRIAHWLWNLGRRQIALLLQARTAQVLAVDIHPAATIGGGFFMDHATGVVIGETAVVGDNVSMLHAVTLGGTGKDSGDRHPKIRDDVLLGAGVKVLGNIEVGRGAKVGAGSVVVSDVPPWSTVVGVPAQVVGTNSQESSPAVEMDQRLPGSANYCI
ncbi:MAG: serine O-acetyltransferase [Pseudomonadota bacterium]